MIALPLSLVAIWFFVRAYRDRARPYVEVRDRRLTIHAGHRSIHEIDLSLLDGVRNGWNRTILILKDGREVAINQMGFSTGEEANRFRKFVRESSGTASA